MIRVLFILPDLRGGGAERVVLNILRHLDRSRFDITLFLIRRRGVLWAELPDNVRVFCATQVSTGLYAIPCALFKLFRESRSQHVIVAGLELNPTYLAYLVGLVRRKPTIGWVHTCFGPYTDHEYLTRVHRIVSRYVLKRMDRLVFVSEGAANSMRKWLGAEDDPKKDWRIIRNPFDPAPYQSQRAGPFITSRHQVSSPVVVSIGRLETAKGFDILIRAHALLLNEGINHRVVIFGEGRHRSQFEKLAHSLGVAGSVAMPGFVPNIIEELRLATAFVLCSRYEGFGMVLLEAMAAGLPVISADCPSGPSEVLEGGKYGILIPSEDPTALAAALRQVLTDEHLRVSLAKAAAKRLLDFSPERIVPAWQHLLLELSA